MAESTERRLVPYPRRRVFALVADVARYPEFVPTVKACRVISQHGSHMDVDMCVGFRLLSRWIRCSADLVPSERIDVVSSDWPFERFTLLWEFADAPGGATVAQLTGKFTLTSTAISGLVDRFAPALVPSMVAAFVRRADAALGDPAGLYP